MYFSVKLSGSKQTITALVYFKKIKQKFYFSNMVVIYTFSNVKLYAAIEININVYM